MKPASPAISVVICAYNSRHRIDVALDSLRAQDLSEPFEIVAAVSGDDGCAQYLAANYPEVVVVSSTDRLHPGAARNTGIRASSAPFVAFMPDDCVADPGWLGTRLDAHRSGHKLVAGAVSNGTPSNIVGTASYYVEYAASMPVKLLLERQPIPHTLSYERSVFERLGLFPDFKEPGEDTVFNLRCVAARIPVFFEPRASIAHVNPTGLAAYLSHQFHHGEGLAHCVVRGDLAGPFDRRDRWRLNYSALIRYPGWRWLKTSQLLARAAPFHLLRFLLLTPVVWAGYLAGGIGARRVLVGTR